MLENDQAAQKELKRLRSLSGNTTCADCGRQDNSWSSVSLGVFICVTCSDVHRSVGTHVTKVKGCTGTYLWGPDELEKMASVGNKGAQAMYGTEKIDPNASKEQKQRYVVEKYNHRSFAGKSAAVVPTASPEKPKESTRGTAQAEVRKAEPSRAQTNMAQQRAAARTETKVTAAREVSDSLFDELFNDFNEAEDSYFRQSSVDIELPCEKIQQGAVQMSSGNDLDAFLNSTLDVQAMPKASTTQRRPASTNPFATGLTDQTRQGYPACLDPFSTTSAVPAKKQYPVSLDPFAPTNITPVEDPFADWPDF
jgi:hypothetical protein